MKEYSYTSTRPVGRTACTEPQCLYMGALYLTFTLPYVYRVHPYYDATSSFSPHQRLAPSLPLDNSSGHKLTNPL